MCHDKGKCLGSDTKEEMYVKVKDYTSHDGYAHVRTPSGCCLNITSSDLIPESEIAAALDRMKGEG